MPLICYADDYATLSSIFFFAPLACFMPLIMLVTLFSFADIILLFHVAR